MAIVIVGGETGCRAEDYARAAGAQLGYETIPEDRLAGLLTEEFGAIEIPGRAWVPAATTVLARAALEHHLVVSAPAAEHLFPNLAGVLRVFLVGRPAWRTGAFMLDHRLERATAAAALRGSEKSHRSLLKARSARSAPAHHAFDLLLNAENYDPPQAAELIASAAALKGIAAAGLLSTAAESQIQFQARLQLARFKIVPAGKSALKKCQFGHPSEELFANLLDFYRIAWEYEPRSFPLQWDKEGKVIEAFTPDFYLPENDLYVELTTMKQALVTRKNRKIKLLRAIYPHVNIQVFYQKDFQDLVFKHDLSGRIPKL